MSLCQFVDSLAAEIHGLSLFEFECFIYLLLLITTGYVSTYRHLKNTVKVTYLNERKKTQQNKLFTVTVHGTSAMSITLHTDLCTLFVIRGRRSEMD